MKLDLQEIQQSLEKLEQINKNKQSLVQELYRKIVGLEEEQKQLNSVITNLSGRLEATTTLQGKLRTENNMLRRKIRRLEDEFLTSLRQ